MEIISGILLALWIVLVFVSTSALEQGAFLLSMGFFAFGMILFVLACAILVRKEVFK